MAIHVDGCDPKAKEALHLAEEGQRGARVLRALTQLEEAVKGMRRSTRYGFFVLLDTPEKLDRDGVPHL